MGLLEKLKSIFNIEINSPILTINVVKNSNNGSRNHYYDPTEKRLDLDIGSASPEQLSEIKDMIRSQLEEGKIVMERNTLRLLYRLNDFRSAKQPSSVLQFFKDIIPSADYEALEASLFLREVFTQRGDVTKLKKDIIQRFGERGKNIANLCTAGYFEQFLIPLYNSSKESFTNLYDIIVTKSFFAQFVHASMSDQELSTELKNKVELSRKYGIKFFHIHGIGKGNVWKVKGFIKDQKDYIGFFEKEIYERDNIIIVELIFK